MVDRPINIIASVERWTMTDVVWNRSHLGVENIKDVLMSDKYICMWRDVHAHMNMHSAQCEIQLHFKKKKKKEMHIWCIMYVCVMYVVCMYARWKWVGGRPTRPGPCNNDAQNFWVAEKEKGLVTRGSWAMEHDSTSQEVWKGVWVCLCTCVCTCIQMNLTGINENQHLSTSKRRWLDPLRLWDR